MKKVIMVFFSLAFARSLSADSLDSPSETKKRMKAKRKKHYNSSVHQTETDVLSKVKAYEKER